jgi:periplasmic protein TonB
MFDQTFVNTHAQTRKPWTVAVSLTLQTVAVAIALLIPLLRIPPLQAPEKIPVWMPLQRLTRAPEARPDVKLQARTVSIARPVFSSATLVAPATVPPRIDFTPDAPEIIGLAIAGSAAGPSLAGLLPDTGFHPAPPAPVVKAPVPAAQAQLHVGGAVQSAKLVFGPRPAYPALARATRAQGTVRIQAVIGRDGSIRNLQVTSGPPLLINAALDAVRQWRYRPTLLNDVPVEVITDIEVNFTLN